MRQMLDDVSVVEIAVGSVAASYCGKLFADLGADVIKVEPPTGDPLRGRDAATDGQHSEDSLFLHLNSNKRGLVLDPSSEEGRSLLGQLLDEADLVIESQ